MKGVVEIKMPPTTIGTYNKKLGNPISTTLLTSSVSNSFSILYSWGDCDTSFGRITPKNDRKTPAHTNGVHRLIQLSDVARWDRAYVEQMSKSKAPAKEIE